MKASHILTQNFGTPVTPLTIDDRLSELVCELRSPSCHDGSHPTESEIAGLEHGTLDERLARLFTLNDKYRDGWRASARIAGLCYDVQVRHFGSRPISFVPAVADVLDLMERTGCSQNACVAALGGSD